MKAKLVFENIDFERGIDPKTAMGLGDPLQVLHDRAWNMIKKTDWTETGIPGPMKDDFDKWYNELIEYVDKETVLIETPNELKVAFEDGWEETHEEMYENVSFERTGNARAGLDIGGIVLGKVRKDFKDESRTRWQDWVEEHLVGHTITAKMNRIQKKTTDGYEFHGTDWGTFTVLVDDYSSELEMDEPAIMITGEDEAGDMYVFALPIDDKKIWIKQ